jgi:protein TonB
LPSINIKIQSHEYTNNDSPLEKTNDVNSHKKKVDNALSNKKRSNKNKAKLDDYHSLVKSQIMSRKYYPRLARLREFEGQVSVKFIVLADGKIINISLERGSSAKILNKSSLDIVRSVGQVAAIPKDLKQSQIAMSVTFIYKIN